MSPADSHENRKYGIFWMLATMLCFITLDAIMKHLLESYPLVQVTWGGFSSPPSLPPLSVAGTLAPLPRVRFQESRRSAPCS